MTTLADILLAPPRREALAADLVALVERHVAGRAGLGGVALRAGLGLVNRALPDAVPRAVDRLLPDLVAALEPLRARPDAAGGPGFARVVRREHARIAAALAKVADARAARSRNVALKALYARIRDMAVREGEALIPALADVLARHLPATPGVPGRD